ncbi:MAG: ABC transporter ATP-binding protein [Candidimonas sp.]|nr:MAG: ABC transporter ATP-binding protein [Candidimonas sp.]TAM27146.1 MAG: ABC transporter ATP-binding protein [Candidimonas sp.]
MAHIYLSGIGHAYSAGTYALRPNDIAFESGKTYALLGPSGCGKTTMLNIISGLVRASEGSVWFDGVDITHVSTANRNIAQVFQFPVIYQSKTVFENLAFPLHCRHWSRARIHARVLEIAEILSLTTRLSQPARNLTADEKQLISLGRGLVRDDVAAILMDEPLTVIDPQMKFELRRKIKQANEQTRLTVIYVTHDQNEAMSFADEVLVMQQGSVIQRDTPSRLFEFPANTYVGNFIGSPGMNFIPLQRHGAGLAIGRYPLSGLSAELRAHASEQNLMLGIRPEHISFCERGDPNAVPVTVLVKRDHGRAFIVDIAIDGMPAKVKVAREQSIPSDQAWIILPPNHLRFYAKDHLIA